MKYLKYALYSTLTVVPQFLYAQSSPVTEVGSVGSFGGIGLLEMRNARFANDGDLSIGFAYLDDSQNYYATWQATPWLETTLRFSDYDDVDQGIDKGLDVKLRLMKEGSFKPSLAIGLQDLLGDGLFSGEYIVASKKIHDFDVTMGFGFGNLASRSKLYNIMRIFGNGFSERGFDQQGSEKFRFSDYFSGEKMGFFWGVEYKTPIKGMTAKVEYSTLDKSKIPLFEDYKSKTAFNFGVNYKVKNWLEVGGGLHHGNQLGLHITLRQNLHKPVKLNFAKGPDVDEIRTRELRNVAINANDYKDASDRDIIFERLYFLGYSISSLDLSGGNLRIEVERGERPAEGDTLVLGAVLDVFDRVTIKFPDHEISGTSDDISGKSSIQEFRKSAVFAREGEIKTSTESEKKLIEKSIFNRMKEKELRPVSVSVDIDEVTVEKNIAPFVEVPKNVGRTARILTSEVPDNVERFNIISRDRGIKVSNISVLRKDFEKLASYNSSPEEILANADIKNPSDSGNANPSLEEFPNFDYGFLPDVEMHFGSEKNDHFKSDLNLRIFGQVNLTEDLQLYAEAKQHIIGNLDQIPTSADPDVYHVRSDIGRYSAQGKTSIRRMTLEYIKNPTNDFYTRLTAGHLEAMYSGVSGEILYRPYDSSFAFGIDVNYVKQRDFEQLFGMRNYETVTGHASAYYVNKKYDITTKVSVGRYLAKDWGTTIDIYRQFKNGIRIGATATFTDISDNTYGRGSFDKVLYMTIPFDFFWFKQTRKKASFKFRRLDKDGGQKIDHQTDLYDLLSANQPYRIRSNWNSILK